MHPSLHHTTHRPWPLPASPWRWRQSWLDLAFLHRRIAAEQIRPHLPGELRLQTFDGSAWIGLVPFRMAGVGPRVLGPLPLLPAFPELNLRTYVEYEGKPGVWFFSLDAASRAIVLGGRRLYGLPYFHARIRQAWSKNSMYFQSLRRCSGTRFEARCRPDGDEFFATRGGFEHWATERYCLYSALPSGALVRIDVHHAPWPLRKAQAEVAADELLAAAGLAPLDHDWICHCSRGVDVVSFGPELLTPGASAAFLDTPHPRAHPSPAAPA
jgi:uncharacterized protein